MTIWDQLQKYFTPENNYTFLREQMAKFLQTDRENRIPFIGTMLVE
jgi:hypothetical protein